MKKFFKALLASALLVCLLGVLAFLHIRSHASTRLLDCQEGPAKIEGAKQQWALENPDKAKLRGPTFEDLIGPKSSGYLKSMPVCPQGGSYIIGGLGQEPICTSGLPGHSLAFVGRVITDTGEE